MPTHQGALTYNFAKFSEKCMELRNFWPIGVHVRHVPLRSATAGDLAEIGMDTVDS